ncbi:MAG: hypothetical protein Q8N06_02820 [Hydrogenophaga sp.]|nr:hypothetical protein [Hydrogenophaga sp.]
MIPLIWTTKGNLPIEQLVHAVEWRVSEAQTIFIERYTLDGEVVKESTHVCIHRGAESVGDAST